MVKVIHTEEEKKTVIFSVRLDRECRVMLAGTFNEWNPGTLPMNREEKDGVYSCTLHLPEGVYESALSSTAAGLWTMKMKHAQPMNSGQGTAS